MDRSASQTTNCQHAQISSAKKLVVLLDSDKLFTERMAEALRRQGWRVLVQDEGWDLSAGAEEFSGQLTIVMELCPDGVPKPQFLTRVRSGLPDARILVVTAYPSSQAAVLSVRLGADDYLAKPVSGPELISKLLDPQTSSLGCCSLPSLARIEWEYINRVLSLTNGNISAAARILAMGRSTLQRKLRQYPPLR
jgi:two-component system response regulator RegA